MEEFRILKDINLFMSIELMISNCKNEEELRTFCKAQNKTLMQLMKKSKQQEDEINELKKLVINGALPIINNENSSLLISQDSEKEIAKIEINKLKLKSMESEMLTLEEAKKLEIYTKVLSSKYDEKQKKSEREVKEISADSLLAVLEAPETKVE